MHLQQGVGRAGFRLLAFMFFLVGVSGLAVAWAASTIEVSLVFLHIGLAMAAAGMLLLLGAAMVASFPGLVDVLPAFEASHAGREDTTDEEPAERPSGPRPIEFEYADVEPAARAAPERLVVPPAFQDTKPPAAEVPSTAVPHRQAAAPQEAPGPRGPPAREVNAGRPADPASWPRGDGRAPAWEPPRPRREPVRPEAREEMRERYTQNTPMVRAVLEGQRQKDEWDDDVPRVHAQRAPADADNDWLEDGQTIGRCGGCQTRVLAPTSRPVIIVCPACEREKLLE